MVSQNARRIHSTGIFYLTSCISEFNTATERAETLEIRLLKLIFSALSVAKRLSQEVYLTSVRDKFYMSFSRRPSRPGGLPARTGTSGRCEPRASNGEWATLAPALQVQVRIPALRAGDPSPAPSPSLCSGSGLRLRVT